jgi:hypothetical protein
MAVDIERYKTQTEVDGQLTLNGRFRSNGPDTDRTRTVRGQATDSRRTGLFLTDPAQASLFQCL